MKDIGEQLLDILARMTEAETIFQEDANDAYQLAGRLSCELDEAKERIAELEKNGPVIQRAVNTHGEPLMGTMRQVLEDYKSAAATEASLGDEARAECDQLRTRVYELEQELAERG